MVLADPFVALAAARRHHADAGARKAAALPGSAEYHRAVHELGVAWNQVRYWEQRVHDRAGVPTRG